MTRLPTEQSDDPLRDMFVERSEAVLPYEYRKKTGQVSELMFIAGRTMQFIHETLSVARILHEGINVLLAQPGAVEQLRKEVSQTRSGGELLANNLHPMYSIVIVNLCAALEAGIDDTTIVALRFRPNMLSRLTGFGVKKLKAIEQRDLTVPEAQYALGRIKAFTRSETTAPDGWLRQLELVGLVVDLADEHRKAIREVIYVRNCIIHRSHRADDKCVDDVSFLQVQSGNKIRATRDAMRIYAAACIALASAIAREAQKPLVIPA